MEELVGLHIVGQHVNCIEIASSSKIWANQMHPLKVIPFLERLFVVGVHGMGVTLSVLEVLVERPITLGFLLTDCLAAIGLNFLELLKLDYAK
jgi:hypothetical protein